MKRLSRVVTPSRPIDAGEPNERETFADENRTAAAEGRAAFKEKRKPRWYPPR